MTSAQVVDLKGKRLSEVALDDSVFGGEPNVHLLHSAVVRQLANARAGTSSCKTRAEVSGGGRKPWRQKGTGRARVGSIRSPLWVGGGVIFGPKPRDYSLDMPHKMRCVALRSALAARKDHLVVVKDFVGLAGAKTKEMAIVLKSLGLDGKKILLVLDIDTAESVAVERAARNIKGLKVVGINDLNVKDLLGCDHLLTTEPALEKISSRLRPKSTQTVAIGSDSTHVTKSKSRTRKATNHHGDQ
ncbi:MAG: 50S ribosomal protein L4 [Candidatus Melainabacteria bacterium]|nr:50S ribosomal protein L4 [Candidatus Melainabacteria bacterium]